MRIKSVSATLFYAGLCTLLYCVLLSGCRVTKHLDSPVHLNRSSVFEKTYVNVDMGSLPDSVFLRIQGNNIDLDFGHSVIDGRVLRDRPDTFKGIALYIVDSRNVTIRNLSVRGFKIAILAENVENLSIIDCDLSYNYRPRLHSKWDREALSDWLYYHNNENDEWKRYGAAIYLKNCSNALVKGVTCQEGMNSLLMVNCHQSLVYNNNFSFNSGLGIGLYRSSHNKIVHNKLDWNARGYSHGKYARGQDSAAILLYEQSSRNTIAFNSGTHSGDGLFLWAGNYTMDTGLGGCDNNMIYQNDFSHSIANGVEVTFSSNYIIDNTLNDSRYGVWGGYSHHSVIRDNEIIGCDYGIAIEHGNFNILEKNRIQNCSMGIQLWERASQPSDWDYAKLRDIASRAYIIRANTFRHLQTGIYAQSTDSLILEGNVFTDVEEGLVTPESMICLPERGDIHFFESPSLPERLADGMLYALSPHLPRGREFIIVNEWGPYNFRYPNLVLRNKEVVDKREILTFAVFGPAGSWSVKSAVCFIPLTATTGTCPDTLVVYRRHMCHSAALTLEYTGDAFTDQFGNTVDKGTAYELCYFDAEIRPIWDVVYFQYDASADPVLNPEEFSMILAGEPHLQESTTNLAFRWWGEPVPEISADHFAIRATTDIATTDGKYTIQVESDDGIRIWVDGELILERWDIHTPVVDEVTLRLSEGTHHIDVEYFEATGLAVLDVTLKAVSY